MQLDALVVPLLMQLDALVVPLLMQLDALVVPLLMQLDALVVPLLMQLDTLVVPLLMQLDALLVPLHQGVHWALGVVNLRMRRFEAYDSLHAGPCIKHYCATLARWLKDEEPPLHDNRQKLGRKYTPGQCLCST